jgi:hypothetical protein
MEQARHTFISYSRADGEFALKLASDLRAAGEDIWLDQLDIAPGERWDREVERGLKTCRRMLIILSPASAESENVQDEIGYAFQQKKLIIPVLHRPCDIPFRLQRLQYVDFTQDYDRAFARLLPVMKGTDEEVARATGSLAPPAGVRREPQPVAGSHIAGSDPPPKPPSSFRKGLAVGGGAVVLLLVLLIWLGGSDPETPANEANQAPQSAASYGQPAGAPQPAQSVAAAKEGKAVELPCEHEPSVYSPAGGDDALLSITNKRSETLKAYWVDADGKRAAPFEISPGETEVRAREGHFYVVTGRRGDCLKLLKAPGSAVIE